MTGAPTIRGLSRGEHCDSPTAPRARRDAWTQNASPDLDGLLEWCEDLDYDAYIESWASLATSAPSGANVYAQSVPF